ncbi:lisH domain-containing protein ARMC9 [Hydra vulgaris]|uniref:LisH domain-containing protein ARMC9 n=1 Tax=Hydra vulgaris TaxID=6087 RepID=A0ABM4BDE3_HYDVU
MDLKEIPIHCFILDHFKVTGYKDTFNLYKKELEDKGIFFNENDLIIPKIDVEGNEEVDLILLNAFDDGNSKLFWNLWENNVANKFNDNENDKCQKLEFSVHLYFAVYSMIYDSKEKNISVELSMSDFKQYLENKGALLSQTTEFISFYALPFVPNPKNHPAFKVLFEKSWRDNLKSDLESFLKLIFDVKTKTYLSFMFTKALTDVKNEKKDTSEILDVLRHEAKEHELRAKSCMVKLNKLKEEYCCLIGISAELVDSLEQCIRGKMITPEYLVNICGRLFKKSEEIDITKPGHTGELIRSSFSNDYLINTNLYDDSCFPLDYVKIKSDLESQMSDRKKCFVLQALIWRLTRVKSAEAREQSISAFISADIFGCSKRSSIEPFIKVIFSSSDSIVVEYLARYINTVASFAVGRLHMSQSSLFINELIALILKTERNTLISENLLGALQKLSLKRNVQDLLINSSIIEWLLLGLEEPDMFSDYALEYAVALLMNLCLRTIGKKRCVSNAKNHLKLLVSLLSYENVEIKPYVNGTLYSILAVPSIRKTAQKIGIEDQLKLYKHNQQDERQIDFIIKQINVTDDINFNDDDLESDGEDDDDEEGDAIEAEMDKEETLIAKKDELNGEALLSSKYLIKMKNPHLVLKKSNEKDQPLTRPITPAAKKPNRKKKIENTESSTKDSYRRKLQDEQSQLEVLKPQVKTERPRTQSGKKVYSDQNEQTKEQQKSKPLSKNYKEAFASRPKVPRTPEFNSSNSTTPPLTQSISPTRQLSGKNYSNL